jgi:hypothetical protein
MNQQGDEGQPTEMKALERMPRGQKGESESETPKKKRKKKGKE